MMTSDENAIAHAELKIGDSVVMLADGLPEMKNLSPETLGYTLGGIFWYVEDVTKTYIHAVSEGVKILVPIADQFWGDRPGSLEDPFVHIGSISTHIRDLSPEELKKVADEACTKMCDN